MANIPLDTRFIGIAPEVNLHERKTNLLNAQTQPYTMADFIASAGGGATAVTKAEIDILINDEALTPGGYYLISGVDVPLYGGTTILIQAATTNELALAGHGIFYNPKYLNLQATPDNGYGIWSNYINLSMSNIVGIFTNGDTLTADNGATATYLANGFLSWISGDWSLATTIDNGSGATADVTGGVSPSYAIGQDVIWGGKHWINTTGNVGTADDKYTLSAADWTAVPFNATDYNVVADVIHYDYSHDMIIRRKDKWNNDVDGNFQVFDVFSSPDGDGYGNPIKDFQWGNGPEDWNTDDYNYIGVQSNLVKDSYLECINFIGSYLWTNTLTERSYMHNNIVDVLSSFQNNILTNSSINDNTLNNESSISDNTFTDSGISTNTLTNSSINSNTLTYSGINTNTLTNSGIGNNTLTSSSIYTNTLTDSGNINNNTINNGSIQNNTITTSNINSNTLTNSDIYNNILTNGSGIDGNTLTTSSIPDNTLTSGYIYLNRLNNGSIGSNILNSSSYIVRNILTYSYINANTLTTSEIDSNILTSTSQINSNTLTDSYLYQNTLNADCEVSSNNLTNGTEVFYNVLSGFSNIKNSTLDSCNVDSLQLNYSQFNLSNSGTLTSKSISFITAEYTNMSSFNISAATIIYGNYSKQMFKNSAGTERLGYYNALDVFTVVNVNA